MSDKSFAWETGGYRAARADLHQAESDLLDQIEAVARQRRALPPVGRVPTDYLFREGSSEVSLSDLFADRAKPLILIHYMFAAGAENPCPMCTLWVDGYNAVMPHLSLMANVVLVPRPMPAGSRRSQTAGVGRTFGFCRATIRPSTATLARKTRTASNVLASASLP